MVPPASLVPTAQRPHLRWRSTRTAIAGLAAALATVLAVSVLGAAAPAQAATGVAGSGPTGERVVARTLVGDTIAVINKARARARCVPLKSHPALVRSATAHSKRMATRRQLSHQLPGEPSFDRRIAAAGYRAKRASEALASGPRTAQQVVTAWLNSRVHRAILLDCSLRDVGISVFAGGNTTWWTLNAGRR
ncbi:CAP domain-containing protein [Nocardioides sp.]|uniref:CAP domain-containing protein n=1 Tax=Nocardioides sp. TaxID=35761 RepID=UPI0035137F51